MNQDSVLQTSRIISGAMIAGAAGFLGVAAFLKIEEPWATPWYGQILAPIAAVVALGALVASTAVGLAMKQMAEGLTSNNRIELVQRRMIITMAILEGAAMFNAVALLIERSWLSVACAIAMLLVMGWRFPKAQDFQAGDADLSV